MEFSEASEAISHFLGPRHRVKWLEEISICWGCSGIFLPLPKSQKVGFKGCVGLRNGDSISLKIIDHHLLAEFAAELGPRT